MNRQIAWVETVGRDGLPVISVTGEIDLSNAADVSAAIDAVLPVATAPVIVDLGPVTFMDSSGIAMLLRLAARLQVRQQQIRVVVPVDSPIRRVLELTNVDHVIPIDDVLTPPATA